MKRAYGHECMMGIEALIKYHGFPVGGTLSSAKLKKVEQSVKNCRGSKSCWSHDCIECRDTLEWWLKEAHKRDRKSAAPKMPKRKVHAQTNNPVSFPSPVNPPPYHYPVAELQAADQRARTEGGRRGDSGHVYGKCYVEKVQAHTQTKKNL